MKMISNILLIGLLSTTSLAYGTIYKWEDENHQIHYSQTQPDQGTSTTITPTYQPASSAKQEQQNSNQLSTNLQKIEEQNKAAAENAAIQAQNEKIRQGNCERSQKMLQDLERRPRVKIQQADGTLSGPLTVEERDAAINSAKDNIKQYCRPQNNPVAEKP